MGMAWEQGYHYYVLVSQGDYSSRQNGTVALAGDEERVIFLKDLNLLLVCLLIIYCLTCKPVHIRFPFLPFGFYFTICFAISVSIHFHSISILMVPGNHSFARRKCTRPRMIVAELPSIIANVIKERLFWSDSDPRIVFWFCALTIYSKC